MLSLEQLLETLYGTLKQHFLKCCFNISLNVNMSLHFTVKNFMVFCKFRTRVDRGSKRWRDIKIFQILWLTYFNNIMHQRQFKHPVQFDLVIFKYVL